MMMRADGPAAPTNILAAPPWLKPLLEAEFFGVCHAVHTEAAGQSNHFCLDCPAAGPLCPACVMAAHADHHVVQVSCSIYI